MNRTRNMVLAALFTALMAAGAFIKIPVGPVPISLQTLFSMLSGIVLGPYVGALSQIIYIGLGLAGIPVFTSGGGPSYIFNPSFGFLLGFILSAFISGKLSDKGKRNSFIKLFVVCLLSSLSVYCIGVPYMYLVLKYSMGMDITIPNAIETGCLLFIPGDTAKSLIAAVIGNKIIPLLKKVQHDN
ncbi:biotin transporter BioY [[Clostridium] cellulosi]